MSERSERPLSIWEMIWKQPSFHADIHWNADLFVVELAIGDPLPSSAPAGTKIAEFWVRDNNEGNPPNFYYEEDIAQVRECWEEELML